MNRLAPIFGILVLICLLAVVSKNINTGTGNGGEDAKPAASTPATPPAPLNVNDPIAPEISIGDTATAKYKVQVGWTYTETSQAGPAALQAALDAVQQFASDHHDTVSAEIVDLDVPSQDLSPTAGSVIQPGITVNGVNVIPSDPGDGTITPAQITTQLAAAIIKP